MDLDELDATSAELKATYAEIKEYVLKEHGLKVSIEEININQWKDIKITYTNGGIIPAKDKFNSPEHAIDILRRLLHKSGMTLDNSQPIVRGYLSNKIRITVFGTGVTSSGKTTLMSYLLSTIPDDKRIFTIENGTREFDLVKTDEDGNVINNVVHTVTRFSEDKNQNIDQEKLLESALTFNPDYICVAEMKGEESFVAQEAARTGHAVITTTHANSCEATYFRMMILCKMKYDINDDTLY